MVLIFSSFAFIFLSKFFFTTSSGCSINLERVHHLIYVIPGIITPEVGREKYFKRLVWSLHKADEPDENDVVCQYALKRTAGKFERMTKMREKPRKFFRAHMRPTPSYTLASEVRPAISFSTSFEWWIWVFSWLIWMSDTLSCCCVPIILPWSSWKAWEKKSTFIHELTWRLKLLQCWVKKSKIFKLLSYCKWYFIFMTT